MKEQNDKKTYKRVLPNGVTLYMNSCKKVKRVFALYRVNYGSSGVYNDIMVGNKKVKLPFGMAHFLEHTLIEQSKFGNALHYFLDKNYDFNGYTADNFTCFYIIGYKDMKESIKKLIHLVDDPVYTKESIEKVKPAVIEELTKSGDRKYARAFLCAARNLYSGHEEKHSSLINIGTEKETKEFTYELVKQAYDAYYYDSNKTLIIGGNIDIDEMEKFIEEVYKEIKPHKQIAKRIKDKEFKIRKKREALYDNMNNDFMIISFKRKYDEVKNRLKEKIYRSIYYGFSLFHNDDFKNKLNDKKIIIGPIEYDDYVSDGINELTFYADILNEKEFEKELIKFLKENIDNVTLEDFNLYKKNYIASSITDWDTPYHIYHMFARMCDYQEEMDVLDLAFSLDYNEFIKHIKSINYDTYTKVILKNKK